MKKLPYIILLIIIIFVINPITSLAESDTYVNKNFHYSFLKPKEWKEMPEDVVKEVSVSIPHSLRGEGDEYETGFYVENQDYLESPFVLIEQYNRKSDEYKKIKDIISNEKNLIVLNDRPNISSYFQEGHLIYNPKLSILSMSLAKEIENIGTVNTITCAVIGQESLAKITFYYSEEEEKRKLEPMFSSLLSTFHYQPGYELLSSNDEGTLQKKIGVDSSLGTYLKQLASNIPYSLKITVTLLIMTLLLISIAYFRMDRKRKRKKINVYLK